METITADTDRDFFMSAQEAVSDRSFLHAFCAWPAAGVTPGQHLRPSTRKFLPRTLHAAVRRSCNLLCHDRRAAAAPDLTPLTALCPTLRRWSTA